MIKNTLKFFDKLEDKIRGVLSKKPILYAIIASIGIVLIWRGVWHTADLFPILNGPLSFIVGVIILLLTGVFVSSFIGNKLLLSGIKGEKKLTEMSKREIEKVLSDESHQISDIKNSLNIIEKKIEGLDGKLDKN